MNSEGYVGVSHQSESSGMGKEVSLPPPRIGESPSPNSNPIPEILAPVGGREQFFAALNSGADAVFLGLKKFNARARAENFSVEELETLVPLAHRYGMKVLVTLNILIKEEELEDVVETLGALERINVDAVILQDMGIARLARKYFPSLRLHASTQLAIHNLGGVIEAKSAGFSRVVLARELTAEEIKRIKRAVDIELEVFCHGSLCYSYSGLCFFSGAADSRSGNRGECAYTCREPYKVISEPGHGFLFSMRDLDTSHKLNQMVTSGVSALKIEGRKKDAQYVSSVVRLYRKKINDLYGFDTLRESAPPLAKEHLNSENEIRKDLDLSFQRKTTSFFFEGRYHENVIDLDSPTHNGIRVGVIENVVGQVISVRLEDDIEKFDGLKICPQKKLYHSKPQDGELVSTGVDLLEQRYENRELSFSLREMSFRGRKIYEANRGMIVDIVGPASDALIKKGDLLYKTRSNDLKQRVERISNVPAGERLRPLVPVKTIFEAKELSDGALCLRVSIIRTGETVSTSSLVVQNPVTREKGALRDDLREIFSLYGDEQAYTIEFGFDCGDQYFIPRGQLKELKRNVSAGLKSSIEAIHGQRVRRAHEDLSIYSGKRHFEDTPSTFGIKIDRLEYLSWIEELNVKKTISEVIFEPKKMFLPSLKPEDFLDVLCEFRRRTGIRVRLSLPTIIRAWDDPVLRLWLKRAKALGFQSLEIGNLSGFYYLREHGLLTSDLTADFTLYTLNSQAAKFLSEMGVSKACLSIEDDRSSLSQVLENWPAGIKPCAILFKDTPLFIAEACSLTALHNGCPTSSVCGYRTLEIENSKGERFHVAHEGCKSIVYGHKAYSLSGRRHLLENFGVRHFRLDFLTRPYTRDQFKLIVLNVMQDLDVPETHTANFEGRLK